MTSSTTATATTTTTASATTDPNALAWGDVLALSDDLGHGVYLSTVGPDVRPHVAWVMLGNQSETFLISTWRSSQKGVNLRQATEVAMHWPERSDGLMFARASLRIVEDRAESDRLWDDGPLPYDLGLFFTGKDDPDLLFVELRPMRLTVRTLIDPEGPPRVWLPTA
ncbi:hypothetical protein BH10ACT1_BH10ACT1_16520 [soil metagenome]